MTREREREREAKLWGSGQTPSPKRKTDPHSLAAHRPLLCVGLSCLPFAVDAKSLWYVHQLPSPPPPFPSPPDRHQREKKVSVCVWSLVGWRSSQGVGGGRGERPEAPSRHQER